VSKLDRPTIVNVFTAGTTERFPPDPWLAANAVNFNANIESQMN
jgi:hypothetical protein